MRAEQSVEEELAGETEVLGGNMSHRYFVHHKSHMTWPGIKHGMPLWEAGDYQPELWQGHNPEITLFNILNSV
jgi:hypothetical protein